MKKLLIILPVILFASVASAQTVKKTASVITPVAAKTNGKIKAPFLKQVFSLDPAIFSESSITADDKGKQQLNIRLKAIPTAVITITDYSSMEIDEIKDIYDDSYKSYRFNPDAAGFTYKMNLTSGAYLKYRGRSVEALEYKAIFHGTYAQQQRAKAMNAMPSVRKMEGDKIVTEKKSLTEYDTDENNRIVRYFMLPYSPDSDKGLMLLSYEANFGEDKKNDGSKILQTLLDGISPMKLSEYIGFIKVKDTKFLLDFALPADVTGSAGSYSYTKPVSGRVAIKEIADATGGYSSVLEKYYVSYGTATDKSYIEQYKLTNGISVFKQILTLEKKDDDYTSVWYQVVTLLVPDKKIIKKPLLFTLTSFVSDKGEINLINNFILNSISPAGTLTQAMIAKIKDTK